jgi:hypothetical protein
MPAPQVHGFVARGAPACVSVAGPVEYTIIGFGFYDAAGRGIAIYTGKQHFAHQLAGNIGYAGALKKIGRNNGHTVCFATGIEADEMTKLGLHANYHGIIVCEWLFWGANQQHYQISTGCSKKSS